MKFFASDDWKCPKCGTENYIADSVNEIVPNKTVRELEEENIDVPFECDNCGYKEVILVGYKEEKDRFVVDYFGTKLFRNCKKKREQILKDANLL